MAPTVQRIKNIPNLKLGEGPHWDVETQCLYFVDIMNNTIHKYSPSTGQHTKATMEKPPCIIIPVKGKRDQFLVGMERDICIITWDGQSERPSNIEKIAEIDKGTTNRMNDGKCDPSGRLWVGSMGQWKNNIDPLNINRTAGSFFSVTNGKTIKHLSEIGISNGLSFNSQLKQIYYIDSFAESIDALDFDIEHGTITNRRPIFTLSKHKINGLPDGMTIDVDGNLWVAVYDAARVIKINPMEPETLLQTVEIPAKQTTSVAWGGKDLNVLYVTTGSFPTGGEELLPPNNGATYMVTDLGTRGLPADGYLL